MVAKTLTQGANIPDLRLARLLLEQTAESELSDSDHGQKHLLELLSFALFISEPVCRRQRDQRVPEANRKKIEQTHSKVPIHPTADLFYRSGWRFLDLR